MTQRGNITRTLRPWREGEGVSAARLDTQRDALERLNAGNELTQFPDQLAPFRQVFQARIQELPTFPDLIIVRPYIVYADGTSVIGPQNIGVAMPWLLRRTPFDGQTWQGVTYTYTSNQQRNAVLVSDPGTVYVEHITPNYAVGDVLHCARLCEGGTGVGDESAMINCIDLSVGRAWAADPPAS